MLSVLQLSSPPPSNITVATQSHMSLIADFASTEASKPTYKVPAGKLSRHDGDLASDQLQMLEMLPSLSDAVHDR